MGVKLVLLTQLNPTSPGWIYFEQHSPRNSGNGTLQPYSSKCAMSTSIQWPLVKSRCQSSSPVGDNAISIAGPHSRTGELPSGYERRWEGCKFQMKEDLQRHRNKIWNYKYDVFSQIYRFYLSIYLNQLIIVWCYHKLVYIKSFIYVLEPESRFK